jgi:hypothetical protein
MANQGWISELGGGSGESSTARTTGRESSTDGAAGFIKGSRMCDMGDGGVLDSPSDLYEPPGQGVPC